MRLGFLQYAVYHRDRDANLAYLARALNSVEFDLLALPELFTCGYAFDDPAELAAFSEDLTASPTVAALRELAAASGGALTGTIPERAGGQLFNTAILVDSTGLVGIQRKKHLPDYEKRSFTPGQGIATFAIGGAKVGMMSCFDCWFPAFGAFLKQEGAQIFVNSASFGGPVTPAILPVRARENQVFVVSCNRIGTEYFAGEPDTFCGQSQIISPDGRILTSAGTDETLAVVEIDLAEVDHPAFGSLICHNFPEEHRKYRITV